MTVIHSLSVRVTHNCNCNYNCVFLEWQPCHSFAEGVDVFFFFITLKFQSQAIWYKILFQIIFLYLYEQPIFALAVYFLPLQFQPSCSVFNDHQCDQNYQILIFNSYEFITIQLIGCTAIFLPLQFQPSCSVFDDFLLLLLLLSQYVLNDRSVFNDFFKPSFLFHKSSKMALEFL